MGEKESAAAYAAQRPFGHPFVYFPFPIFPSNVPSIFFSSSSNFVHHQNPPFILANFLNRFGPESAK
jgi:hypothetical protein